MMYEEMSRERIARMQQEREQIRLVEEAKASQEQNPLPKVVKQRRSFFSRLLGQNAPKQIPAVEGNSNQTC